MKSLVIALALISGLAAACTPKEQPPAPAVPTAAATEDHAAHDHGGAGTSYTCPMHPEVKSDKPGRCPKCGMDLVAVSPDAMKKTFDVVVTTTPPPETGKPTKIGLEIVDDGKQRVKDFEIVHEKKLHLLMVSKDLSWFAHEHPELSADGTMALDFTFPAGGDYVLYSDFRPAGATGQVIHKPIKVAGPSSATKPLVQDDLSKAKTIAGHQVRLKASSLTAGDNVRLDFVIVKDGKPVTDLAPYLGAQGHCVIISQDGSKFLHSHPDDGGAHDHAAGTADHAHPKTPGQVTFATQFPVPGLYKIWGQFLHGNEMIIADFVVDVAAGTGTAPAGEDHGAHKH